MGSNAEVTQEAGPVDLCESVLQVHGQEAPLLVVVSTEPSSGGLDGGFTADCAPEPQLSWAEVSSKAFAVGRHRSVAAVLFQCRSRGNSDPGDTGAGYAAFDHDADHGVKGSHQLVSG